MLTDKIRKSLIQILEKSFKNTFELGGGKEHRFFHGLQVATFSQKIAEKEKLNVDFDVLFISALFHDIGKIEAVDSTGNIDYGSEANRDHEEIAAKKLSLIIGEVISDKELLEKCSKIILSTKTGDELLESTVIKDADELGNFGYLQVWRTFTYAASDKQNLFENINYWYESGRQSRLDMISHLNFGVSRTIAEKRLKKIDQFFDEIKKESDGADFAEV
jgi:putative nucleotidyltransferase with HDIG domain